MVYSSQHCWSICGIKVWWTVWDSFELNCEFHSGNEIAFEQLVTWTDVINWTCEKYGAAFVPFGIYWCEFYILFSQLSWHWNIVLRWRTWYTVWYETLLWCYIWDTMHWDVNDKVDYLMWLAHRKRVNFELC